jgi:hypothetical protein
MELVGPRVLAGIVSALALLAAPAVALADHGPTSIFFATSSTELLSRSVTGEAPNGPSRNPVVSQDQRNARVFAYESDASDILPGDTNGVTDVYAIFRREPFATNGTPWETGRVELLSRGLNGIQANGRSYGPAVDGNPRSGPSCVAFISDASNLVPGDTNRAPDAFVRDLRNGKITRVSTDSNSRQANGPTTEVAVSGDCGRVAFTSRASNLVLRRTDEPAWLNGRTTRAPRGRSQIYVKFRGGPKKDRDFRGLTFLASASNFKKAGSGDSYQPAWAPSGKFLAFTSTAGNLTKGDGNGQADVFLRKIDREFDVVDGKGTQTLDLETRLVSTNGAASGNGPSSSPTLTDSGQYVAYQTGASNLLPGDTNGVTDIAQADMRGRPPKQVFISRTQEGIGDGPSNRPALSGAAHSVWFDTEASNLRMQAHHLPDPNGQRDVVHRIRAFESAQVESLTTDDDYVGGPSQNVAISSRNNYVLFESTDWSLDPGRSTGGIQQVYLRYLAPQ